MKHLIFLAAYLLTSTAVYSDDPRQPVITGQRVATCAHSFHAFTYQQVKLIAESAGLKHTAAGFSGIGGSTVKKHWDVPEDKSAPKQALIAGNVDVLTLSPIWLPDEAIESFVKLGVQHNPALRVTVQEYWMPNDEYEPVYPLQTKKKVDHNATDLSKLREDTLRYAKDIEDYVRGINQRLGHDAVLIVPVGIAAVTLREKIVRGEVPGIRTQAELFRDNWGHAQPALQLLSSYCHFAVIYRRSPTGLPLPNAPKLPDTMSDDDKAKLNTLLQEIAWETVSHHSMTGLMESVSTK